MILGALRSLATHRPRGQRLAERAVDRRREMRKPILIAAALDIGHRAVDCMIVDIATNGVRLQIDEDARQVSACIGQHMLLRPNGGGGNTVIVRWIDGRDLGMQFLTAVSLCTLETPLDRSLRLLRPRPGRARVF